MHVCHNAGPANEDAEGLAAGRGVRSGGGGGGTGDLVLAPVQVSPTATAMDTEPAAWGPRLPDTEPVNNEQLQDTQVRSAFAGCMQMCTGTAAPGLHGAGTVLFPNCNAVDFLLHACAAAHES